MSFDSVGLGGTFAMMLAIMLDAAHYLADAAMLSALVQGGGFLITAAAPLVAAWIIAGGSGYVGLWAFHSGVIAIATALVRGMRQ